MTSAMLNHREGWESKAGSMLATLTLLLSPLRSTLIKIRGEALRGCCRPWPCLLAWPCLLLGKSHSMDRVILNGEYQLLSAYIGFAADTRGATFVGESGCLEIRVMYGLR